MTIWINETIGFGPCNEDHGRETSILDVRDLVDREGNDLALLQHKIETGAETLRNGKKLVVCCDLGLSRSAIVTIGILSLLGKTFDDSAKIVAEKLKDQSLNLDLLEDMRKCLKAGTLEKLMSNGQAPILVTGGTGFIGRHLIQRINRKHVLYFPTRADLDLTKDVLSFYREVRNREIGLVIHLAHPRLNNSLESLAQSIAMMRNVLEMCRLNDTSCIFFSSLDVFDGYHREADSRLKSDLRPRPISMYGQSKALCEELVRLYREAYKLKVVTLRLPIVIGKDMSQANFLWKTLTNALENRPVTVHRYLNGFQKGDFLFVDDLIDAVERCINCVPSEDINLGTGNEMTTLDKAKCILATINSKSKLSIMNLRSFTTNLVPDTEKAKEILGWKAKTSFPDAIKKVLYS